MKTSQRRNFLKKSMVSLGAMGMLPHLGKAGEIPASFPLVEKAERLPREVWIATLTQHDIEGEKVEDAINAALKNMEMVVSYQPDIICLPEAFHVATLKGGRPALKDSSDEGFGPISQRFANFAKQHKCYVIAPIYTKEGDKYYNAAVVLDRQGNKIGEYRKIRPTVGEMNKGICPGERKPPVFTTDFGKIGIQTCWDIEWQEGWQHLSEAGAEIVFWTSAFAGGKMVNTKAWLNKYVVVSSTRKGTTKICDMTGEEIAVSGQYNKWGVCAPVNLEKAFLHTYPFNLKFPEIMAKYGRDVRIETLHEEEFTIIESRSPNLKVADILKEFDVKTHDQMLKESEEMQNKYWT